MYRVQQYSYPLLRDNHIDIVILCSLLNRVKMNSRGCSLDLKYIAQCYMLRYNIHTI